MKKSLWIQITAVATASLLAAGAPNSIGAINVAGDFRLNGQPASAHATLSEGAALETKSASGDIYLAGGVHVLIGAGSEGRVYRQHLVLVHGAAQFEHGQYAIDAHGLQVSASGEQSVAGVTVTQSGIQVAALSGQARVANAAGSLVAWVPEGRALSFDVPANDPTPQAQTLKISGKVFQQNGKYYIIDRVTNLKIELRGELAKANGHDVDAVGDVVAIDPAPNVAYAVTVTSVKVVAAAAAEAGAATGLALGTKAIIAGVIVAAGAGTAVGIVKATQSSQTLSH